MVYERRAFRNPKIFNFLGFVVETFLNQFRLATIMPPSKKSFNAIWLSDGSGNLHVQEKENGKWASYGGGNHDNEPHRKGAERELGEEAPGLDKSKLEHVRKSATEDGRTIDHYVYKDPVSSHYLNSIQQEGVHTPSVNMGNIDHNKKRFSHNTYDQARWILNNCNMGQYN